jgi:hypothetical protein
VFAVVLTARDLELDVIARCADYACVAELAVHHTPVGVAALLMTGEPLIIIMQRPGVQSVTFPLPPVRLH